MFTNKKDQHGATLVGVLIAMVVAGIGLYALMQTQGEMTSGISSSKARAEAMQVAQKAFELQRAYIHSDQFDTDLTAQSWGSCNSVPDFTGVNADFSVECKIVDASVGNYKQAMVRVTWIDEKSNPQSVSLNNFILFKDPSLLASIKQEEDGTPSRGTLNRRGRWGDERAEEGTEGDVRTGTSSGDTVIGTNTNLYKGVNSKGNWEIYIYSGTGTAKVVFTAKGGIIHEIKGRIYFKGSGFGAEDLSVFSPSPAYCVFPINNGTTDFADYVCYVPGDCSNEFTIDGTTGNLTFNENDYNSDCKSKMEGDALKNNLLKIRSLKLDGGWYGRVGLLLTSDKKVPEGKIPMACLKDLIPLANEELGVNIGNTVDFSGITTIPPVFSFDSPARYFASRKIKIEDSTIQQFEGINQSLACQDMLFTTLGGNETCQGAAVSAGLTAIDSIIPDSTPPETILTSAPYFEFDNKLRDLVKLDSEGNPVPILNTIEEPETYGVDSDRVSLYPDTACHNRLSRFPDTNPADVPDGE